MSSFTAPTTTDRAAWAERIGETGAYGDIVRELECLWQTDLEPTPIVDEPTDWLRVAVWNLERGRDPVAAAKLIAATGANVTLLSEVDVGMARTSNRDVARVIASELGAGSAFGIEFIELALGKATDLVGIEAGENVCGLHGNAIVSRLALRDPEVIRLDEGGAWFNDLRGEPRIGGRMALAATIELDGVEIEVVSVHLESHSDEQLRAGQIATLLERVDRRGAGPAIVAGDFNTFGAPIIELADPARVSSLRADEPARFSWPVEHEPLFDVAAAHGFAWTDANVAGPTTRHAADGSPHHLPLKLDWVLVRGLEARRPTVVPAVAADGSALSDHELLAVSLRVPR